ncbi:Acid phosphatase pho1 [Cymbomonas tetramitiformis]|uniref:Alpha-1,4 glucan phosphorylase n=1 Tax=Cymbomonas tetramitiformis TaxID=36881 RepID=A0AAE0FMF6_9CHLO|nr:Acid phosphatase pho1 [Cymbomonas tetramitiformis]
MQCAKMAMFPVCRGPTSPRTSVSAARVSSIKRVRSSFLKSASKSSVARRSAVTRAVMAPDSMKDAVSLDNDAEALTKSMLLHYQYSVGMDPTTISSNKRAAYEALACAVGERLAAKFNKTQDHFKKVDQKYGYYLSAEFLQGRALLNAVENLELESSVKESLAKVGYTLEDMAEQELDMALGNGGLGRLAACFLDSMATLDLPMFGYGIRYSYGMFKQLIDDGFQKEEPDYWLGTGNPWEIERPSTKYPISFGGKSVKGVWTPADQVYAVAHDNPIPGWNTDNTISLRLWGARPVEEFDLSSLNSGKYQEAFEKRMEAETICAVLYPDDSTTEGKILRLKQQYFFTSASLQDIIARFLEAGHTDWDTLPDHAAVQLNDTHPTIGVAELMRLLMDDHGLEWDQAWAITGKVFAYTNHTVLPEALEKWGSDIMEDLLPRNFEIIEKIDKQFVKEMTALKVDKKVIARMKPIGEDEWGKGKDVVRMASLAMCGAHTVNGVAAVHSEIIKDTVLKDFYAIWPEKFQNKTNGVTQRRWLAFCNPELRDLITSKLGSDEWIGDLDKLTGLREFAEDPEFQAKWREAKLVKKQALAEYVKETTGYTVNPEALFDVQVKRIHEYKRQLLNVMRCIHQYSVLKKMTPEEKEDVVPRVVMIGGKAAPGYAMAKKIIKLINATGKLVNNDPEIGDMLKVIFLPNYNVSAAEIIIPGTELSEQISTAGTEASGTSNMKFAMNGALLVGTMDGANIEIWEEIGKENGFIFGAEVEEVDALIEARNEFEPCEEFQAVLDQIEAGDFGDVEFYQQILDALSGEDGAHYLPKDFYLLGYDFPSYCAAQDAVDAVYKDQVLYCSIFMMFGCWPHH